MNYALIFAGGTGQRMKSKDTPKQLLKVHDKEIIIHTLEHFEKHSNIERIVVVFNNDYIDYMNKLIEKYNFKKIVSVVSGGKTGQQSIYNGLVELSKFAENDDLVLIHDGVRPLINKKLIDDNIEVTLKYGNSISSTPAIETVLLTNSNFEVSNIIDRTNAMYGRAPQTFKFGQIFEAHQKSIENDLSSFIDSASMMKHFGHSLYFTTCSTDNIKITTIKDYYIFKAILDAKEMDQFDLEESINETK